MRWLFFRLATALLLALALALGSAFVVFGVYGDHFAEMFVDVPAAVLAPAAKRLASIPADEREQLVADTRERLGLELVLETPPEHARDLAPPPAGADAMRFATINGQAFLYARIAGTSDWIRMGPLDHRPPPWTLRVGLVVLSLVVVAAVSFALSRTMARQLASLYEATARLEAGDMSARARVHSRNEIGKLAAAFNAMASRREADLAEREALLQAVAHELGTPLARMHFSLDFLRSAATADVRQREIASIEAELSSLDELMRELVAWVENGSRGNADSADERTSIVELVRERVGTASHHARNAIEIAVRIDDSVSIPSAAAFRRVLDNLLRNAERYAATKIVVELRSDDTEVFVEVRDDGPGVPEEHRARIFEPFTRLEHARSRESGGVGLGLAIVARIVKRVGGRVWVDSAPEGGACVAFTWPRM